MNFDALFARAPLIPVLTIDDAATAVDLGKALVAGGLYALEVTLRTPAALKAIEAMAKAIPEAAVGCGTVRKPQDFIDAKNAGATFAVSPGATAALIEANKKNGLPWLPGIHTASEAMAATEAGYTHLKFFPAESAGGVAALKSLAPVLPEVKFCPTGGIGRENMATYLALPNVPVVGGSWVTPKAAVSAKDWKAIEELAKAACAIGK